MATAIQINPDAVADAVAAVRSNGRRESVPVRSRGRGRFDAIPKPLENLAPGLQVAPWRHSDGLYQLIRIDAEGRLAGQWAIGLREGCFWQITTIPDEEAEGCYHSFEIDDTDAFARDDLLIAAGCVLMPPGISVAPYRTRVLEDGVVLVALDRHSRWISSVEVAIDGDLDAAIAELQFVLRDMDPVRTAPGLDYTAALPSAAGERRRMNTGTLECAVMSCRAVGARATVLAQAEAELADGARREAERQVWTRSRGRG